MEEGRLARPKGAVLLVWHNADCNNPVSYGRGVAAAAAVGDVAEGEVAGGEGWCGEVVRVCTSGQGAMAHGKSLDPRSHVFFLYHL